MLNLAHSYKAEGNNEASHIAVLPIEIANSHRRNEG